MAKSESTKEKVVTAIFQNTSKQPQIFRDVEIDGVKYETIRVLQGSKVELEVNFGRKHRKVLAEIVPEETTTEATV